MLLKIERMMTQPLINKSIKTCLLGKKIQTKKETGSSTVKPANKQFALLAFF